MENITISMKRFEDLLHKEAAVERKREALTKDGYVSEVDKLLFNVPVVSAVPEKENW